MRRVSTMAAALLATSVAALAEVAPGDVTFTEDGAIEASLSGAPGSAEEGRKVIVTRSLGNCIACHQVTDLDDQPFHGEVGPSLDGVADRWDEAHLRGIVANAKHVFEGTIMPSFYKTEGFIRPGDGFTGKAAPETGLEPLLTAQQVEDVVAYLATLKE